MKLHGEEVKVGDRLWDYEEQEWVTVEETDDIYIFFAGNEAHKSTAHLMFFWQEVPPITPPPKPKPEIDNPCSICGEAPYDSEGVFVGTGYGDGNSFAHKSCWDKQQTTSKPEIDWSKVPEGTLVRVRDRENDYWMVGEFLGLYKNGKYIYRIKDTYPDNDPAFIQIKLHESVEPKEEWMK